MISGVSRSLTHQLVRHRIASYTQRHSKIKEGVLPSGLTQVQETIMKEVFEVTERKYNELLRSGCNPEDARAILPNACTTRILVTMNARSLQNFFKERICRRAQTEIRDMAF